MPKSLFPQRAISSTSYQTERHRGPSRSWRTHPALGAPQAIDHSIEEKPGPDRRATATRVRLAECWHRRQKEYTHRPGFAKQSPTGRVSLRIVTRIMGGIFPHDCESAVSPPMLPPKGVGEGYVRGRSSVKNLVILSAALAVAAA